MGICRLSMLFSLRNPSFEVFNGSVPIYLYLQPEILGLLLEPLFLHQEAGLYPNQYSIHDLGSSFPNATGHPEGTPSPVLSHKRQRRIYASRRMWKHDIYDLGIFTIYR